MIKGGPKIINDGLVLCLDAHDANSYAGEPTTNVVTNTDLNTGWSKGYQSNITYDEIDPPNGITSQVVGHTRGNSSGFWYSYGDYAPQVPNTVYTVSMYVKTLDSNFRIRFYTADNSETGRVYGSNITVPNDGKWHRVVWNSFTNPSNSQSDSLSFNFFYGGAINEANTRTWFCAPQMEAKSYATPFVASSRSATIDFSLQGNKDTGTSFTDSSPTGLTVTGSSGVTHSGSSPFGDQSISFTRASSQYISTASSSICDFGTGEFTIEFWFNMNSSVTTSTRMHALNIGTGSTTNISFDFNDSGYGIWVYWMSGGTPYIRQSGNYYNDSTWHHCRLVRDNGTVRLWVDGTYIGGNAYSTQMGATQSVYIGSSSSTGHFWDGYIDDVRIIKGIALWRGSGNFPVPTRRGDSSAWVDRSGNSNGGNLINMTGTIASHYRDGQVIMPVSNSYLEFDGTDDYIDGPTITPNIGAFTYEAVIYRTSSDFLAVGTGTALGGGTFMQIFVYDAGMRVNLYAPQGIGGGWRTGSTIPNTSNTFVNNNIYHVTVVNDGTVFYFYKNGVSLGSYDHSYLSNTSSTRLGILRNHVQSVGGTGRVYLARMYNKALTSAEVLQNYNATKGRFS